MQAMARSRQWFLKLSSGEAPNRASVIHKFRSRFYVLCAFLALEKMLFKFIAQGRRKFAQHVVFRSLYSYSFVMVHFNP